MEIRPPGPTGRLMIERYGGGEIRIGGTSWHSPVLVFASSSRAWPIASLETVTAADFLEVMEADPRVELLLIGCGERARLLPSPLRAALKAAGITVEAMDTSAACRTFNVLTAERRRIAAALIPI